MGVGISSIDPVTTAPRILTLVTCAGLMRLDGLRVVPEIAVDNPKVTNGGKTYTFTIRKEARFSTGSPVTARSFVHTINRLLHPTMQSAIASNFNDILGAQKVIDGKAETVSGIVARGRELIIRLKQPVGDLPAQLTDVCVVPESTPIDPEGVKAPAPSAGPYYFAEFVLGVRVVLERNRYYRGDRPHHVDRFTVDLTADVATVLDRVDRGELDYAPVSTQNFATRADEFRRKYGINKSRFWVMPVQNIRMFVLNTSGPLFRNNPKLRQAVNFAVDRRRLEREFGPFAGTLTDQ
jgi:peptide/nickel transport system substrate-binding protein